MLPLWRDRLKVVLTPKHVTLLHFRAGLKPREVFNKTMECAAPQQDEAAWQPALRILRHLLKQANATSANAEVIVSNHFVRYQLVKAQPDIGGYDEEQGFVKFSFSEVYGNESTKWVMRWGDGLDLKHQVASAIDQALLDGVSNVFAGTGIKLISLQPYLMPAFNHVYKVVEEKPVWFILVEEGRACVALLKNHSWQALHVFKLEADWAADLPNVLEREFHRLNLDNLVNDLVLCLPSYFDHKRLAIKNQSVQVFTMTPETLLKRAVLTVVDTRASS